MVQLSDERFEELEAILAESVLSDDEQLEFTPVQSTFEDITQAAVDLPTAFGSALTNLPIGAAQLGTAGLSALGLGDQRLLSIAGEDVTLEDLRQSLANVAGQQAEVQRAAVERSPIAGTIGKLGGEIGQLVGIGASAATIPQFAAAGAKIGGVSGALQPKEQLLPPIEELEQRAIETAIAVPTGAILSAGVKLGLDNVIIPTVTAVGRGLGKIPLISSKQKINILEQQSLGLEPTVFSTTTSPTLNAVAGFLAKTPGGIKPFRSFINTVDEKIRNVLSTNFGFNDFTKQTDSARNIISLAEKFNERGGQVFNKIDKQFKKIFPGNSEVKLNNVNTLNTEFQTILKDPRAAAQLQTPAGSVKPGVARTQQVVDTTIVRTTLPGETRLNAQGIIEKTPATTNAETSLNTDFKSFRHLRSTVRNETKDVLLKGTEETAQLERLHAAMTADMREAIKDPRALQLFDRENAAYVSFVEDLKKVEPIIKAAERDTVNAIDPVINSAKASGEAIKVLMASAKTVPAGVRENKLVAKEMREALRSIVVKRLGLNKDGNFDSVAFFQKWEKLLPEAKVAVLRGIPEKKSVMQSLSRIAQNTVEVQRRGLFSKEVIGLSTYLMGGAGVVSAAAGSAAGLAAAGTIGSFVLGARIASTLYTNPAFLKYLTKVSEGGIKNDPKIILSAIEDLPRIAASNPDIREDVIDYINEISGVISPKELDLNNERTEQ